MCPGAQPEWDMEAPPGAGARGMSDTQSPRCIGPCGAQPHSLSSPGFRRGPKLAGDPREGLQGEDKSW